MLNEIGNPSNNISNDNAVLGNLFKGLKYLKDKGLKSLNEGDIIYGYDPSSSNPTFVVDEMLPDGVAIIYNEEDKARVQELRENAGAGEWSDDQTYLDESKELDFILKAISKWDIDNGFVDEIYMDRIDLYCKKGLVWFPYDFAGKPVFDWNKGC